MFQVIVTVSIRHKKAKQTHYLVGCSTGSYEAARALARELAGPRRTEPGPLMELFMEASLNASIKFSQQKETSSHASRNPPGPEARQHGTHHAGPA
jgi:hypothetical protein